jgi:hypothetical protein
MAVNLAGRLESADVANVSERVSISNISSHGACVIAHRDWQPYGHVILVEPAGDFRIEAEVIYCRPLTQGAYLIGLMFRRAAAELLTRPGRFDGHGTGT